MALVATVTFLAARNSVFSEVSKADRLMPEAVELSDAAGRVLAECIHADRDYPPFARSARDGFALRVAELPGELKVTGEVRAGEVFAGEVKTREAVEIMTGAPVPPGADAVVMVEHTTAGDGYVKVSRTLQTGENITPRGSEAGCGDVLLSPGRRLGFAEVAMLATVGCTKVSVYAQPRVGIIATGDEIVEMGELPLDYQIRNSNAQSLAVQVKRAGGIPQILPIARDRYESTRPIVEHGLESDLLLLSGGVSAGKYDIVERVLADLDAEFYFDRVLIQPGQPLVFGKARGKFFFGLPGNPASTMVTFEIFARLAVELIGGQTDPMLPLLWTRLACDFRQKTGLTRFLPATLSADGSMVTPIRWQGSGDVPSIARANTFLVTDPERESWAEGDMIQVLLKQ
jgi:molybdopterin molybdotransferase